MRSLNVTLNLAMDEQFVIHTPLMDRDKSEVWELSDELGVFDLVRTQTLTCYNGVMAEGWALPRLQTSQGRIGEISEKERRESIVNERNGREKTRRRVAFIRWLYRI